MKKTEQLRLAFNAIKAGGTIQPKNTKGKIWIYFGFIYWQNFGQSANKIKISELRWIFKTIFKAENYEFTIL